MGFSTAAGAAAFWGAAAPAIATVATTAYTASQSKGGPSPMAAPKAPDVASASAGMSEEDRRRRLGAGRSSTLMGGALGAGDDPTSARKTLLGG